VTDDDLVRRRQAFDRKNAHQERSSAALDALREQLGVAAPTDGSGQEWLKDSGVKPLVDLRCRKHRKLGGVWRTDAGPIFVAWPEVSAQQEGRDMSWTVTVGDSRRRGVVDLVSDDDPHANDRPLRVACECHGLRSLPVGARSALARAYSEASGGRPTKVIDEDLFGSD
jgi:hypothetical protein